MTAEARSAVDRPAIQVSPERAQTAAASDEGAADAQAALPFGTAEVREIVARSGSSFLAGMRILPRPRREGMHAVYAFCRLVDDIADSDAPAAEKRRRLDGWEAEIGRVYAGAPRSAVGAALVEPVARYELPQAEFGRIVDGMRMDVEGPIIGPTRDELRAYVRCVAGAVGLLSMRVFGAWVGEPSARFALALAEGLQLINILRDVEEDARLGRVYLPSELLEREGVPPDPARLHGHPALPRVLAAIGADASRSLAAARAEVAAHPRLRVFPALLMMGPYERLLTKIERGGWTGPPPRLGRAEMAWLGLRCALRGNRVA